MQGGTRSSTSLEVRNTSSVSSLEHPEQCNTSESRIQPQFLHCFHGLRPFLIALPLGRKVNQILVLLSTYQGPKKLQDEGI